MVSTLTVKEWAQSQGMSKQSGYNAIKRCGIPLVDGKVDPDVATTLYRKRTRARTNDRRPDATGPADAPGTPGTPDAESPDGSYWESRSRREAAEAELAEMKLAEQRRTLISVKAVSDQLALDYATTREGLLQLPSRLGSLLAAEGDPAAVERLLRAEIHQALTRLAGAADAVLRADSAAAR
jgi:hypothetical protein